MDRLAIKSKYGVITVMFTAILWIIFWAEISMTPETIRSLCIQPLSGKFIGILTAGLMHGSWQHVAGNTAALLIVLPVAMNLYPGTNWKWLYGLFYIFPSIMAYCIGGEGRYHLGASGFLFSLFGYIIISGILSRDAIRWIAALVILLINSTLLISITKAVYPTISYEMHLGGFIVGSLAAIILSHYNARNLPYHKVLY